LHESLPEASCPLRPVTKQLREREGRGGEGRGREGRGGGEIGCVWVGGRGGVEGGRGRRTKVIQSYGLSESSGDDDTVLTSGFDGILNHSRNGIRWSGNHCQVNLVHEL